MPGHPALQQNTDLVKNTFGGIQAYTTTEVPALRRGLGTDPNVTLLEGLNGTKLGYSQVMFTADECLEKAGLFHILHNLVDLLHPPFCIFYL